MTGELVGAPEGEAESEAGLGLGTVGVTLGADVGIVDGW